MACLAARFLVSLARKGGDNAETWGRGLDFLILAVLIVEEVPHTSRASNLYIFSVALLMFCLRQGLVRGEKSPAQSGAAWRTFS